MYEKLDTKEVENDIYKIDVIRERKTRDFCTVRRVKDEDQKVWAWDEEIKEKLREYFDKLFNGSSTQDLDDLTIQCQDMNRNYMRRISESEVKETMKMIIKESRWPRWNSYWGMEMLSRGVREMTHKPL